jgi:hypothetical protein
MVYYLTWFDKNDDDYIGEALLKGIDEIKIRQVFELTADDAPGDCFEVDEKHVNWLESVAIGVKIQLNQYSYFVEASKWSHSG